MTRVALYARYSDDLQRDASIEDQFRICREQARREDWRIVGTYRDAAISGASVILRPGIQTLLQDAQRGQFDVVLAEALDRISRDQADIATLFKHLRFANVTVVTLAEGEISELHVGLKGTMNALFLKDLAAKTHRGLRGRVEHGKSGGGIAYGYGIVKQLDQNGEFQRGDREIIEREADIVRRIFREFAAGDSPRLIARRLNDEGIKGPNDALWLDTTIRGHVKRGTGLINNELYIGRLVWNRQRFVKDPSTGRRVARLNPESEWIVAEVPHLRIVEDDLWRAAKARQAQIAAQYVNVTKAVREAHASNRLNALRRPRTLLSGLIYCGCCGGPYALRGQDRFVCSAHVTNRSCSNSRTIARSDLEARALAGLKDRLMAPQAAAEAMRAYAQETNRLNHERRAAGEGYRAELAKIARTLKQMLKVIEDGGYTRGMTDRMRELEAREDELKAPLAQAPVDIPDVHPNVSELYRRKVERLAEALNAPEDRAEASAAIRALIEKIVLTPGPGRGEVDATLHGELGAILDWIQARRVRKSGKEGIPETFVSGMSAAVGAGTGFEPVTFRL
jgi:site-specific DNA recombinase